MTTEETLLEPFGMELKLDLRDERNAEIVRRQFKEHGLLVARAQSLTHDHQIALMGQLGTVLSHVSTVNVVSNVRSDGYLGNSEVAYHSDASYTARPMHAISLHALRIEGTTSTKIASGIRAFDRLPAALQTQITQLKAIHLVPVSENTLGGRQRLSDYPDEGPRAVHPVVMLDPVTNKHTLYVPYTNTDSIVGWEADRSQELLDQLQEYIYSPDNVYEHFWQEGDLMIWSNIGYHHARGVKTSGERTLNRVCTTDADIEMYEESTSLIQSVRRTSNVAG